MAAKENQLLSDFIGFEYQQPEPNDSILFDYRNNPIQFERDWNLLMGVWDKFRDLKFNEETKSKLHTNYVARLAQDLAYGTILEFFNNVQIAIKWYNINKM